MRPSRSRTRLGSKAEADLGNRIGGPDLCRLAGLQPAGVICELVKADDPNGDMARRDDCFKFAKQWGVKMISIEQIEQYRREKGL